jgi:hypothetical protein
VPVREARAEIRWVSGKYDLAADEARAGYAAAVGRVHPWMLGSVAIWLRRTGEQLEQTAALPEPYPWNWRAIRTRRRQRGSGSADHMTQRWRC